MQKYHNSQISGISGDGNRRVSVTLEPHDQMSAFAPQFRILFQGDSITDMNRGRDADPNHILGHSYAFLIAAKIGSELPERKLVFINRGVSGNKVADLDHRWQTDTLDLKPDVLSILIGVNDLNGNVSVDDFADQYDKLLSRTVTAIPKVKLVLCEPFGLHVGEYQANWGIYHSQLILRQATVQKLAVKYYATFVPLQQVFEDACNRAQPDCWIWDGVHPTYSGQQLIANEWIRCFGLSHVVVPGAVR